MAYVAKTWLFEVKLNPPIIKKAKQIIDWCRGQNITVNCLDVGSIYQFKTLEERDLFEARWDQHRKESHYH